MIDQVTIDKIMDAAQIQDVVSDYVTLRKRGVNLIGLCPFHNEKTPSFTVSPAKGIFKCFGCGKGGNSVHFIMEHEQVNYYEALKLLAKKYHIEVEERELTDEEKAIRNDRESMFLVNDYAQKYFSNMLHNHIDGKAIAKSYLQERGFREDIIQKFQLGYCLDEQDAFTQSAISKGFNKTYLIKTGLTTEYESGQMADRFRGRLMFPVHSISGKVVAFGGRTLKNAEKTAKYVNSPESDIYHKSNELYGIYFAKQAIVREDRCFLVEGYTDVMSMHQNGIENVVSSSGTSLTPGQIRMIHRFTENVTIIYDGDTAGIAASLRGIDLLLEEGLNIQVLLLPAGEDPDSFAKKQNSVDFIAYVKQNSVDFIRFKTNLLIDEAGKDPVKRAKLIIDIVKSIAIIPNAIIRAEYVKECSNLLHVEEAMLYHEINKLKKSEAKKTKEQAVETIPASKPQLQAVDTGVSGVYTKEEINILKTLIRFGTKKMKNPDNGGSEELIVAGDFIFHEINLNQLTFETPTHQQMLEEYEEHYQDENFDAEKYFLYHPNPDIVRLTADLVTEKYTLSKIHSKVMQSSESNEFKLCDLATRVIYEYKYKLLTDLIKEKLISLKAAAESKNHELEDAIMMELREFENIKKDLAKRLGERVIFKI
ncbi:MAG TPA: DNA primase [Paludibacter sp.]|nr:MAG: DNA primase [Bacteroidetes bacterium ADurb.Bin174]HQB28658.1 DNA primase [Paludibacter sp.]